MSAVTFVIVAAIVGLLIGAALLPAGVFWALPIAAVLIVFLAAGSFRRRASEAQSVQEFREGVESKPIEFTERDKQTLVD
jgi:uncharacterized membrane protein